MSVPTFIDLSEALQVQELRTYLKSKGAEISEENSETGIITDLVQVIEASNVCWKECNEFEVEVVFNSIINLVSIVPLDKVEILIVNLCEKLGKAIPGESKKNAVRFKLLSNLFGGLDENSPYRYTVYVALVKLAGQSDLMHEVRPTIQEMRPKFAQWEITQTQLQNLLRLTYEGFYECKKYEQATKVMIELLGTYTAVNAAQAREDAHKCIVTCIADPNTYLLDHLLTLKPVKFLEGELIHDLLTIFVQGKLTQYLQFYNSHKDFLNSTGLSHEQNLQKMRLLTFMQMAETRTEIDYETIHSEMQVEKDDVESFIIDVVRTKAVRCKIDQMSNKVIISSTTHRTFGKQQWQMLRERLEGMQRNLAVVLGSLQTVTPP